MLSYSYASVVVVVLVVGFLFASLFVLRGLAAFEHARRLSVYLSVTFCRLAFCLGRRRSVDKEVCIEEPGWCSLVVGLELGVWKMGGRSNLKGKRGGYKPTRRAGSCSKSTSSEACEERCGVYTTQSQVNRCGGLGDDAGALLREGAVVVGLASELGDIGRRAFGQGRRLVVRVDRSACGVRLGGSLFGRRRGRDLLLRGEDADEESPATLDGQALMLERVRGEDDRRAEAGFRVERRLEDAWEKPGAAADEIALGLGDQQQQRGALLATVRMLLETFLSLGVVDDNEGSRHGELECDARQFPRHSARRQFEGLLDLVLAPLRQARDHDVLRRQADASISRSAGIKRLVDSLARTIAGVGAEHPLDFEHMGRTSRLPSRQPDTRNIALFPDILRTAHGLLRGPHRIPRRSRRAQTALRAV
mmetsp:Transcript_2654/g.8312  ORF Transcript_2654/g.8312 Transcript_2654/m.8312 type:complete len:420 (-) Transcript_2654:37-1296(-)